MDDRETPVDWDAIAQEQGKVGELAPPCRPPAPAPRSIPWLTLSTTLLGYVVLLVCGFVLMLGLGSMLIDAVVDPAGELGWGLPVLLLVVAALFSSGLFQVGLKVYLSRHGHVALGEVTTMMKTHTKGRSHYQIGYSFRLEGTYYEGVALIPTSLIRSSPFQFRQGVYILYLPDEPEYHWLWAPAKGAI